VLVGTAAGSMEGEVSTAGEMATAGRDDLKTPHGTLQFRKAMAVKALASWKGKPSLKQPGSLDAPIHTCVRTHTFVEPLKKTKT